ncbi:11241_t:CDS:2 [Acaulospora colombiana]|uniref:11241_t:CDS:1 n=1 Tax=Acaulospora colombiana TaxID=27376 RepID=A0ACA9JVD5_9GLOM|nr:11241_t:CDS:2 [Acaulospora colombiana]
MSITEPLTNTLNPTTSSTLTIRIVKNFEYRTVKNLVLQHVNLETTTVGELKNIIREKNESEISFFNREAYEAYKLHPDVIKWD